MRECCLALVFLLGLPVLVGAQTPSASEAAKTESAVEQAQRLFSEGTEELLNGRAALARDLLRRSLALSWRVPTRYNLAVALRQTGATTEAIATFEGLLEESDLTKEQRALIGEQLEGSRGELATLYVRVTGTKEATIEIDGHAVGQSTAQHPYRTTLDAGSHIVVARADGTGRATVDLKRGDSSEITLHVMPPAERAIAKRKKKRRRAGWITGASVVVAGAVIAAATATRSRNSNPIQGDTDVLTVTK